MLRTRVKICGLTNYGDIDVCINDGADAVGCVFAESVRRVTPEFAASILEHREYFLSIVAVFKSPSKAELAAFLESSKTRFDYWQMDADAWRHAPNSPATPRIIPVYRWGTPGALGFKSFDSGDCTSLVEGARSGSGETFDWHELVPHVANRSIILAGGLTPENVAEAIRTVRPYGVDVSSGVESSPGKKDPIKIRDFLQAVRDVDRELQ